MPHSARCAWWVTAWLSGLESTDDTLEHLGGGGVDLLALLRRSGANHAGLALAREGELVGLGGPAAFNHAVIEAGEGLVVGAYGLVPAWVDGSVEWEVHPAQPRQVPGLREATQDLRETLLATANGLAELDVARWNPDVADALSNLRHLPALEPPSGTPPECAQLAARGVQAIEVVELALRDDGGAVSAHEIEQRRALLAPLATAGRRALVAACSPEVWPPANRADTGG